MGYADDIAVVVMGKTEASLKSAANIAVRKISDWMKAKGLAMAPEKTEAVVLEGRRKLRSTTLTVEGVEISTRESIKYLGVVVGRNGNMGPHIAHMVGKASEKANILSRIMPNIGGPRASRRRVLCSAVYSLLLYAAPVWKDVLRKTAPRRKTSSIQRKLALRICCGYRTAPTEALLVIAGTPPMDLLAEERSVVYRNGQAAKQEAREELLRQWQQRWLRNTGTAIWTKTLIPDLIKWTGRRHGEVNYYVTQALTGHGCFQEYLHRFKRSDSPHCVYCGDVDSPKHTLFECDKWVETRRRAVTEIGERITPVNMVNLMLSSKKCWSVIAGMVVDILKRKEDDERKRQREEITRT